MQKGIVLHNLHFEMCSKTIRFEIIAALKNCLWLVLSTEVLIRGPEWGIGSAIVGYAYWGAPDFCPKPL